MTEMTTTSWAVAGGALICVVSLGCADTSQGDPWEFEDPPPKSRVDPSSCTDLSNDELEEPEVSEVGESRWKIRYPSFRRECGAYQLQAVVDFDAEGGEGASYTQTFTVCNRCESTQTWNYLTEFGSTPSPDSPKESQSVPRSPRIDEVPGITPKGKPVVGHQVSSEEQPVYEAVCEGGNSSSFGGETWVSYGSVWQLGVEPGESITTSVDVDIDQALPNLQVGLAASDDATDTTILWPKLFHAQADITGLEAASVPEFCIEQVHDNRPQGWVRPYTEPYEVDAKYTEQITSSPQLPVELDERLRERQESED